MYEDGPGWFALIAIGAMIYLIVRVNVWKDRAGGVKSVQAFREEMEAIQRRKSEDVEEILRRKSNEAERVRVEIDDQRRQLLHSKQLFESVQRSTERTFPWVAKIHSDLISAEAESVSRRLERKKHPAQKAADEVRRFRDSVAEIVARAKHAEYKSVIYESAFPFLVDLIEGAPTETLAAPGERARDDDENPERRFIAEAEYERLSTAERSQLALERYKRRGKTNWEIGRDYERFIGYQYEKLGWEVEFHGAMMGFDDLGRDLIARRPDKTLIIQCKYWAQWRDIHESAVFQLFGSLVDYLVEKGLMGEGGTLLPDDDVFSSMKRNGVEAVFVTSTSMSERASKACEALRIKADCNIALSEYPMIKCNVGRNDQKLYHLPFDQQYDRIKIEKSKGEFYAFTAVEAEAAGFRRAFKWRPDATT